MGCARLHAGAAERGATKLRVHTLTDGRDVEDGTSVQFVARLKEDLEAIMKDHPKVDAKIASGGGRMRVTMDRYEVGINSPIRKRLPASAV